MDPQIFQLQKFGGISRLFTELWKRAVVNTEIVMECPLLYSENVHLLESGLSPKNIYRNFHSFQFKGSGRVKDLLKSVSLQKTKRKLRKHQADVFLVTYYDTYFMEYINDIPFVLTVYDMIHEIFPDQYKRDAKTVPQKKWLMEKARKIIAISEQTRNDIIKFYPHIPAEKIEVIYLSQSVIETSGRESPELPENYVLFVGNRGGYKNFELFMKSAKPLLEKDLSLQIVCAGGGKFTNEERIFLTNLGLYNRLHQYNYKDKDLAFFYKGANFFVFPSSYEGFGIPTLEAMKCGCPVLLADTGCLKEIGADAALYFETGNQASLELAMRDLLGDVNLRMNLIERGYKRVNDFSWDKTASQYFSIIKSIAS